MDDSICPVCASTDIDGGTVTIDSGTAYQSVSCNECDCEWTNQYTLSNQIVPIISDDVKFLQALGRLDRESPPLRVAVIGASAGSFGLSAALQRIGISANESQEKVADFSNILCDLEKRIIKPVHHKEAKTTGNKSDRKRNRANRWR